MTATTLERRLRFPVWPILVVAFIAMIGRLSIEPRQAVLPGIAYDLPGVGRVIAGAHADERHGREAARARELVALHPWRPCQRCMDGRYRCIGMSAGEWGLVVLDKTVGGWFIEVTAFLLREAEARMVSRDCQGPHSGHDLANAAY